MATLGKACTGQPSERRKMAAFESKKYSWKSGYSYKVSAETVGNVLEKIKEEKGYATSDDFLEYSRDEESETHSLFEWDDAVAAEKFRHRQSAQIINQLEVEIVYTEDARSVEPMEINAENTEMRSISVNAFSNIGARWSPDLTEKAKYVDTISAMRDADTRKQVLLNASKELTVFKRKYMVFKELALVISAINNFQMELALKET